MSKKFSPDPRVFREILLEERAKGKTWRKIAVEQGVSRSTLYEYMDRNGKMREAVDKDAKHEIVDNLRSTALELALVRKNPTLIIFLCKAIAKMFDIPTDVEPEDGAEAKEELYPSMTRDQWKKLHDEMRERQKKKCVS